MEKTRTLSQSGLEVSDKEYAPPGHTACAGCGGASTLRILLKLLGPKVMVTNPASCSGYFARALQVPLCRSLYESAAAWGTGMRAALDVLGDKDTVVLVFAGDGGTVDIGLQSLSATVERNEDIVYVCYDNEGYMMTGMQRSGATPAGAWTTTTPIPQPKVEAKKDIIAILAAHGIPYAASATLGYHEDFVSKVLKAKAIKGSRFLNILAPCPTGWRSDPQLSFKVARMAVQSHAFPLLEVQDGLKWIVQRPKQTISVKEYLSLQGRFAHLSEEDVEASSRAIEEKWTQLLTRASAIEEI